MKRIDFYYFLTVALVALVLYWPSAQNSHPDKPTISVARMPKEERASHMIKMVNGGQCTGTAIGPHAILTAEHCDENDSVEEVTLDYATAHQRVARTIKDNRDHIIMLLDGPAFTNIETVKSVSPVLGDGVTIFGNGEGVYPARPLYGHVVDCNDPSDIDADAGATCFSFKVIPGDSGSAIYNKRGEVVGLVTYRISRDPVIYAEGFVLDFTAEEYADASSFVVDNEPPAPRKKAPKTMPFTCDPFRLFFGGCR